MTKAQARSAQTSLQEWCDRRKEKYGKDPGQALTLDLSVYQDDILEIAIGDHTGRKIDEDLPRVLHGTFGVRLSTKEEANNPLRKDVDVIGALYELANLRNNSCAPSSPTVENYAQVTKEAMENNGQLLPKEVL